jgi:hypothetical protein
MDTKDHIRDSQLEKHMLLIGWMDYGCRRVWRIHIHIDRWWRNMDRENDTRITQLAKHMLLI